jgi:hypothetical protein
MTTNKAPYDMITTVRRQFTTDVTLYVRTDGNDANDGSADDAAHAFLTVQAAIDLATTFDLGGNDLTIQVADGTYTGAIILRPIFGGTATIKGNAGTPANVLIDKASTGHAIIANAYSAGPLSWTIKDMKIVSDAGSFSTCVTASGPGALITCNNVDFGACSDTTLLADTGGTIILQTPITISGSTPVFGTSQSGGLIYMFGGTITVTGTPAWGTAMFSVIAAVVLMQPAFSGSATGKRYSITGNGVINTGGQATTFFPGNVAGTTATGGQYI